MGNSLNWGALDAGRRAGSSKLQRLGRCSYGGMVPWGVTWRTAAGHWQRLQPDWGQVSVPAHANAQLLLSVFRNSGCSASQASLLLSRSGGFCCQRIHAFDASSPLLIGQRRCR